MKDDTFCGFFKKAFITDYFNFTGCSGIKEYWSLVILELIILLGVILIISITDGGNFTAYSIALVVIEIVFFIPSLSLTSRRLHDIGYSGWFNIVILLTSFFYIGIILWAVVGCLPPKINDNIYR